MEGGSWSSGCSGDWDGAGVSRAPARHSRTMLTLQPVKQIMVYRKGDERGLIKNCRQL